MLRTGRAFHLAPRERRLRTAWHRAWGTVTALLGLALLLVSGVALFSVPSFMDEERALRAAGLCPAGAPMDGCLRTVVATVRGTVIREEGKTPTYILKLSGPPPVPAEVYMGGPEPLLGDLRPGDTVTVMLWRDYAPAVSMNGVTQATEDTPVGEPQIASPPSAPSRRACSAK